MKAFIFFILALLFSLQGFATPQRGDRLIYNGDTLRVHFYLPDEFWESDTTKLDSVEFINRYISAVKLFGNKKLCNITSCYAYYATWEILENQLYLTGIYSCCYYEDSIKADLNSLFKEKVIDGKVKADWVTGNFISPKGARILYQHWGYGGIFEYELELHFEKGKLTGTQLYDNGKTRQSEYNQNNEKRTEYIYSNINWDILPKEDTIVKVLVRFSANEDGIIDEVEILKNHNTIVVSNANWKITDEVEDIKVYNEIYDQETIRVIQSIPEWDAYFEHGKHVRMSWSMLVVFSEENKLKYQK